MVHAHALFRNVDALTENKFLSMLMFKRYPSIEEYLVIGSSNFTLSA